MYANFLLLFYSNILQLIFPTFTWFSFFLFFLSLAVNLAFFRYSSFHDMHAMLI